MQSKTHKPVVSVIIIFLDAAQFMQEAIESLFDQTFEDWELLLVDDGSTDGSTDIACGYAYQCPGKIRYLQHSDHRNHGMSASRNLGVRHADGKYIAFLDADDVWLPHKLEQQVKIMDANPEAGMVYGMSQYWYSWTGDPADSQRDYVPKLGAGSDGLIMPAALLTLSLKSQARTPCPSDFLLRREILKEVGGFEEHFSGVYQLYEDQAFLAKVFLKAPVFLATKCWDKYRRHPQSCVAIARVQGTKYSAGLFYLNWLKAYLLAHGIKDAVLWSALRSKRRRYRYPNLYSILGRVQRSLEIAKEKLSQAIPVFVLRRFRA